MSLPYGVNVRLGEFIVDQMESEPDAHYDSKFYIEPEKWYLEIIAQYESSALRKEFQFVDSIIMMHDGAHFYFEITD